MCIRGHCLICVAALAHLLEVSTQQVTRTSHLRVLSDARHLGGAVDETGALKRIKHAQVVACGVRLCKKEGSSATLLPALTCQLRPSQTVSC